MVRLSRLYHTIRFGRPIVVVSGLPRAGTSMAMRMLEAGGVPIVSDGVRAPDESNPRGYFECERVKDLDKGLDNSWLADARGKAIKIISFLLRDLPDTNNYRVIFMHRAMDELIASQNKLLTVRGEPVGSTTADIAAQYQHHLGAVRHLLATRPCFTALHVNYRDVVESPHRQAARLAAFVGGRPDSGKMAAAVEETLYRTRA